MYASGGQRYSHPSSSLGFIYNAISWQSQTPQASLFHTCHDQGLENHILQLEEQVGTQLNSRTCAGLPVSLPVDLARGAAPSPGCGLCSQAARGHLCAQGCSPRHGDAPYRHHLPFETGWQAEHYQRRPVPLACLPGWTPCQTNHASDTASADLVSMHLHEVIFHQHKSQDGFDRADALDYPEDCLERRGSSSQV